MYQSKISVYLFYFFFTLIFIKLNLKKNRDSAIIPLISLSNMLHKLHFINDSLSVAIAGVITHPDDFLLAYYLGNIYVVFANFNASRFKNQI